MSSFHQLLLGWRGLEALHGELAARGFTAYRRYEALIQKHCDACGLSRDVSLSHYFEERAKEYLCSGGRVRESQREATAFSGYRSRTIDRLVEQQLKEPQDASTFPAKLTVPHPCLNSFNRRRYLDKEYALWTTEELERAIDEEACAAQNAKDVRAESSTTASRKRRVVERAAAEHGFRKSGALLMLDVRPELTISISLDFGKVNPWNISLHVAIVDNTDYQMPYPILLSSIIPGFAHYGLHSEAHWATRHRIHAQLTGVRALGRTLDG